MTHPIINTLRDLYASGEETTVAQVAEQSGCSQSTASQWLSALSSTPFPALLVRRECSGAHRPTNVYRVNPAWGAVAYPEMGPGLRPVEEAEEEARGLVERGLLPPWTTREQLAASVTPVVATGSTTALAAFEAAVAGAVDRHIAARAARQLLRHLGVPTPVVEGLR